MAARLTHIDESGAARMVDVGDKPATRRMARATARVVMAQETLALIQEGGGPKGDVLQTARLAGTMAAKRTGDLVPLCHTLPLESVEVDFQFLDDQSLRVDATACVTAKTGVEMEAMTAASVAALTVYDMIKAVDRGVTIGPVQLEEKLGGRSGHWRRTQSEQLQKERPQ